MDPPRPLKEEFTNFDNLILNDGPQWYSNILEGLRIWSPQTGVIVFLRGPEGDCRLRAVFGLNFPSITKCGNYMHKILFLKSYPYMGAIISEVKIQIILSLSIQIILSLSTFLMLKTAPKATKPDF